MKLKYFHIVYCYSIISLLILSFLVPISITQIENKNFFQNLEMEHGRILYAPMYSNFTYLLDKDGDIIHTWCSDYSPGFSVYMLEDGSIFYSIRLPYAMGGFGGGVQKIAWDGTLLWDFRYYSDEYSTHHDIKPLSNGNVLMIAWEAKTYQEVIAAGRNPSYTPGAGLWPDYIIEVEPTGQTTGDIVWEWHSWDHLIQDYDSSKDNYGVVKNHPELIDINYGPRSDIDWLHTNSVDYNEEFDQILISVPNFNEIWVIDHSTSTEEAAGHTGGNSGKGGDLLYRWGNPQAYRAGDEYDQKFFFQHDAKWIKDGIPGEGNILVFNNGDGRIEGEYSSVDEIVPPVDLYGNYYLESGSSYGPEDQLWIYTNEIPNNWYANIISGAERLDTGNTLICDGLAGKFFEVTPEKEKIWEYVNPYPNYFQNSVFKIQYIKNETISPSANFIFYPDLPKKNDIVYFNDKSTDDGTIISWFWDFGDGSTSTEKNPTHIYSKTGISTITLKVTDDEELTDTISKNIKILTDIPPFINNLKAVPPLQIPGGYVNLSAQITDDIGLKDASILIQYPDNYLKNISIIENKNHDTYYYNDTFDMIGQYIYSIWAIDDDGNQALSSPSYFTITNEYICDAGGPYYGFFNQTIQFEGYAINGEPPYSWQWDFGDGYTSEEQNPIHIYTNSGNYTVTLFVTDSTDGPNSTINDTTYAIIEELPYLPPPEIFGPKTGKIDIEYYYYFIIPDITYCDALLLRVDWGDGTGPGKWFGPHETSENVTLNYRWQKKGDYTIKAMVKDVFGTESDWGIFNVNIHRSRISFNLFIERFWQNHSILQKILKNIEQ